MLINCFESAIGGWGGKFDCGVGGGGGFTHPPLKAPTGFRAGKAVAVASWRREVDCWKVLVVRRGVIGEVWRIARIEGARSLEAMVGR